MSELKVQKSAGVSFVERKGTGSCLVFLHGIGSHGASFEPLFDQLPPDLHLIAWNAPGYGTSDPLAQVWPMAGEYAEALSEFLRARGFGPVILIGHSLGTLIASAFAWAYPDRVSQLVLASCAAGYGVPMGGEMPASVAARINDLNAVGPSEFARTRAVRLVFEPEQNSDVVALVQDGMSKVNSSGYAQAVRMLASGTLFDTLRQVTVPCSFITGTEDHVTPPAQTLDAAKAWATSRGVTPEVAQIEQAGHAVYVQQPQAFAATLLRLVAPSHQMIGDTND